MLPVMAEPEMAEPEGHRHGPRAGVWLSLEAGRGQYSGVNSPLPASVLSGLVNVTIIQPRELSPGGQCFLPHPTGQLPRKVRNVSMVASTPDFATLQELRPLLLKSHKILMEAEKDRYEASFGPIANKGEYLRLVLHHEQFSWLRPISQLIVEMDEVLMARTPPPPERATEVLHQARTLLQLSEVGEAFFAYSEELVHQGSELGSLVVRVTELLS